MAEIYNKVTGTEMAVDPRMLDLLMVLNNNGLDILFAEIGHEERDYKDFYIKFRPNTNVDVICEVFDGLPIVIDSRTKKVNNEWRTWSTVRLNLDRNSNKESCLEKINMILSQETVENIHMKLYKMLWHDDLC